MADVAGLIEKALRKSLSMLYDLAGLVAKGCPEIGFKNTVFAQKCFHGTCDTPTMGVVHSSVKDRALMKQLSAQYSPAAFIIEGVLMMQRVDKLEIDENVSNRGQALINRRSFISEWQALMKDRPHRSVMMTRDEDFITKEVCLFTQT